MANVWSRSGLGSIVAICSFAFGNTLLGGTLSSALAITQESTEGTRQLANTALFVGQVEDAAEGADATITENDASNQSAFVLAALRTLLSDLRRFPLFLPDTRGRLIVSSDQISPLKHSQPSLFWIQDQVSARYGSDRLVEGWRAYQVDGANGTNFSYVDVVVNERIWDFLTYFERYAFIEQFGSAAQDYGYHLRVFHTGDVANATEARTSDNPDLITLRGAHLCSFDSSIPLPNAGSAEALPCTVVFDSLSRRRQRSILSN